jgi:glycosyltransferase involved in cell wall biosynthesis
MSFGSEVPAARVARPKNDELGSCAIKLAIVNQPYDGVLPPRQNSIGLITFKTAVEIAAKAQVVVYGRRNPSEDGSITLPFDMRFIQAPWDDKLHSAIRSYPRWAKRLRIEYLADSHRDYTRRVANDMERSRPDVVHVMNYWEWSQRLRNGNGKRKLVLEMQCEWLSQKDARLVGRQLQAVDAVVGVSDHITSLFKKSFPKYSGLVATAYNGVEVDVFKPAEMAATRSPDAPSILFVGRVSPEKGVHTLLDAFALVLKSFPDATLEIVGAQAALPAALLVGLSDDPLVAALRRFYDGSMGKNYQSALLAQVRKHKLEKHVRFVGGLPHAELVATYQNASLVVNPSLSESFGIAIVEGMACGIPVVGTRVGGMLETIRDGETGFLVEPEQPELLAAAMARVLEDPALARRLSAAARERAVTNFSWKARAGRLADVYTRLV